MVGRRTRVHERLGDNGQARVDNVGLVDVEHEIRILDQIDPKAQRQTVGFPRVDHLRIGDAVLQRLVVQEVEHVLDGQGECRAAVGDAEDRLEQVVDVLLQRDLGREQARQVDLRHHFVAAALVVAVLAASAAAAAVVVVVVANQMPHLDARILIAAAVVSPVIGSL